MSSKDRVLVYSDDPKDQLKISGQADIIEFNQQQLKLIETLNFVVVFRLEKNGRAGKTVTVMDQFPVADEFLKNLTKELKAKCGVGGSYFLDSKFGRIEIQGDKRDSLKKILDQKKIKYKGV